MSGRAPCRFLALSCLTVCGVVPEMWAAGELPVGVSPGGQETLAEVEDRCPTFSWGGAPETSSWELVVYRLTDGDLLAGAQAEDARPVLSVDLPGTARAWTPALGQCLEPGGRYAWSVRGFGKDLSDSWSDPRLFRVTAAPSIGEVRDAMAVLSAYLGTESLEVGTDLGFGDVADKPIPVAEFPPPAASPEEVAASLGGSAAIRGVQTAPTGDASGVIGETASADGAGGVFGNLSGGPDLFLDGSADTETDTVVFQSGLDRSSGAAETFDIGNSGAGDMTLTVDGVVVVTTATDADSLGGLSCVDGQVAKWNIGTTQWECAVDVDTLFTAGNQLNLGGNQFDVVEGSGSGLDADTVDGLDSADFLPSGTDDWVNVTGDTMTGTLTLNPAGGNAITTGADIDIGGASIRRSGTLFLHRPGNFNTGVGFRALENNTTAFSITAVGEMALRSNTEGLYNTAVGTEALELNVDGDHNTAIGRGALRKSTASNNTALGSAALWNNTTGEGNTAVGRSSLIFNTEGNSNVAVGHASLNSNTTGSFNIAVGRLSMFGNTEGLANIAVGHQSLTGNSTGNDNVAVGHQSLASSTTASNNTAIGRLSMFSTTEGNNNVGVGSQTMLYNTLGSNNTAVGRWSLRSNTAGEYNVAVGNEALLLNEVSGNTAVGDRALKANTTGHSNGALGSLALANNTTGSSNTAVGSEAMYQNTTGEYNSAVGFQALRSNTTGTQNSAFGDAALKSNTAGNSNTASGTGALSFNTVGFNNTADGRSALALNTEGGENTAVGAFALSSNTTGSENTAIGTSALAFSTESSSNTAVGFRALFNSDAVDSNTALGSYALYSNSTGYYNVAVGHGALTINQVGTDNVGIGHNAGKYTDGASNILINNYGVAGEDNTLRIGRSTGILFQQLNAAFIQGIHGRTATGGVPVLINGSGQLGTTVSSRRFKEGIRGVDEFSDDLMDLRPVQFRFTEEQAGTDNPPLEFGLIAEEVAQVFPDLVIYDEEGLPFTVRYQLLTPLLLNEVQQQRKQIAEMSRKLEALQAMVSRPTRGHRVLGELLSP